MTKKTFAACLFVLFALLAVTSAPAQQVHSLGLFTGFAVPYTWDEGITKDSRYRTRFDIKYSPIGVHYGIDNEGYGFTFDPSLIHIGQNFNVINTSGGEVGKRNIDLKYFQLPIGLKIHIIDMSFFKVSFVASIGAGVLLSGKETISHQDTKLKFPLEMTGSYPSPQNQEFEAANPGYTVEYDGVLTPVLGKTDMLTKDDFQQFQFFGAAGFRSDWDFSENWRASFDLRANIGILEPRKADYLDKVKNFEALYDIYGARRDLFLSLTFGIARSITIERRQKQARMDKHTENKPRRPAKYPWPSPRNKKPKG